MTIKQFENKIIQGDCIEVMKTMPENSVDTIICDPPYELNFMGKGWDNQGVAFEKETWEEALRVAKPGATLMAFGGTRTYHRLTCAIEDAGWQIFDCIFYCYGSGFPKSHNIHKTLKKKGSKKADEWLGYGTALKPAVEPIVCARKPNEGTYAQNALKYGVSGLNIDGGRIGMTDKDKDNSYRQPLEKERDGFVKTPKPEYKPTGRFPANIILDEEVAKLLDEQSGESKSTNAIRYNNGKLDDKTFGKYGAINTNGFNDTGGASRFFYTAKASKSERNMGCEGLEEKQTGSFEGNADTKNTNRKIGAEPNKPNQPRQNFHPTVKPLKLMEYLCTLTKTPTGGIVLDPFLGSGTTAMACKKTGRTYIGIEKEAEYVKIAEARIKAVKVENKLPL